MSDKLYTTADAAASTSTITSNNTTMRTPFERPATAASYFTDEAYATAEESEGGYESESPMREDRTFQSSVATKAAIDQYRAGPSSQAHAKREFEDFDANGPNVIHHDMIWLKPKIQRDMHYIEEEEVERVTTHERHVHHVQYHYVFVDEEPAIGNRETFREIIDDDTIRRDSDLQDYIQNHLVHRQLTSAEYEGIAARSAAPKSYIHHHHDHFIPAEAASANSQIRSSQIPSTAIPVIPNHPI